MNRCGARLVSTLCWGLKGLKWGRLWDPLFRLAVSVFTLTAVASAPAAERQHLRGHVPAAVAALTRQSMIVCDELLTGNRQPSVCV